MRTKVIYKIYMWALILNEVERREYQQNLVPAPITCPDFETEPEAENFLNQYVSHLAPMLAMDTYLVINKTYKIVNE